MSDPVRKRARLALVEILGHPREDEIEGMTRFAHEERARALEEAVKEIAPWAVDDILRVIARLAQMERES